MDHVLLFLFLVPLAMTVLCLVLPRRANEIGSIISGVASFTLALVLLPSVTQGTVTSAPFLRVDALSEVFLLATAFLYPMTAIYSMGYLSPQRSAAARDASMRPQFSRYSRLFYIGLNAFAWSLIAAPLVNGLAYLWVAVEITTVVSALLVAIDRSREATEASWKYVLIASSGLGIALLATIILY